MPGVVMRKVTISLPLDLVEFADRAAQQAEISRSQVIGQALSEARARVERRLAEEGYRFYAGESVEFATASALAVAEAAATYQAGEIDDASETW